MRRVLGLVLIIACGCTGTRIKNPGHNDLPAGVQVAASNLQREADAELSASTRSAFAADSTAFSLALYRELAQEPGNLFFSPYSVRNALAMAYAGAKGDTRSEMASALQFRFEDDELHAAFNAVDLELNRRKDQLIETEDAFDGDGFQLNMINQAWGQPGYEFLDAYLDVLALNYGAGMYLTDFAKDPDAARRRINDWIADRTEQRIDELLPPNSIKRLTRIVLTNAIYFKSSWLTKFDPAKTVAGTFTTEASTRDVRLMRRDFKAEYAAHAGYQAVALPYLSPDVRMLAVLPPAGSLAEAADGFNTDVLGELLSKLTDHHVMLGLPKWSFLSKHELKDPLRALGMNAPFDDSADFSGMDGPDSQLFIHEVYHDAFIAVDEEGTEAAASTAVVLPTRGTLDPVTLTFDRPFLFLVYDKPTGQILFLGHLADPG